MRRPHLYLTTILVLGVLMSRAYAAPPETTEVLRDPRAVQILTASLDAMGGQALWRTITATKATGTTRFQGSVSIQNFDWVDDWSTTLYRVRKRLQDEPQGIGQQEQIQSPSSAQNPPQPAHQVTPDFIEGIVAYAPAAAIFRVLTDQSYALHVGQIENQAEDTSCVMITNVPRQRPVGIWCFAPNHLPLHFIQATAPLPPHMQISSKTVSYNSFTPQGSALMPSSVTVTYPFGQILNIQIAHIDFNPTSTRNSSGGGQ